MLAICNSSDRSSGTKMLWCCAPRTRNEEIFCAEVYILLRQTRGKKYREALAGIVPERVAKPLAVKPDNELLL